MAAPIRRPSPVRGLIITADDFGLAVPVNEAVERAHRGGVLGAASLMVGAPAAADAIERARHMPGLRVGLHLVLADGAAALPRARIPDLVDDGGRFGSHMARDGIRFFALPAVRRQLAEEIRAQFEAFAATGLALDHVNAHKHFHLHPTVLSLIIRIGRDYGLQAVRVPREPAGGRWLSPWLALMRLRLRHAGLASNDYIVGLRHSGAMTESRVIDALASLPEGVTEFYFHPGTRSGIDIAPSMEGYRHTDELDALLSPRVRERIEQIGCPVGGFSDVLAAAAA
jgi:hopanoid biosynthesis associated protein HpnK